jgi:methionyl aminopeptidase
MAAKTPDGHRRDPDETSASTSISAVNPPKPAAASGLLQGALEGEDEDGDGDDDHVGVDLKSSNGKYI